MTPDKSGTTRVLTRRRFLGQGAAAIGVTAVPAAASMPANGIGRTTPKPSSFLDLLRSPDLVTAYTQFEKTLPGGRIVLQRSGDEWRGGLVVIGTKVQEKALLLTLSAPSTPLAAVHVRWQAKVQTVLRVLGDAWERSYGDLGWRDVIPERVMPWYFATHDGDHCHAYGVKTDSAALCFWQLDREGVSLWLNVTNGGNGVDLGQRTLNMAMVISRMGMEGEPAIDAVAGLCRTMCARVTRPMVPIYGINDWNYSYGHSTAESIVRDTEFLAEVAPGEGARPFSVIDEGWSQGTAAWPDMGQLAVGIKQRKARPGIWVRPLRVPLEVAPALLLPDARFGEKKDRALERAYDPTHPEAQQKIRAKVREITGWGYEMVKHDFTTYDLLGQWGFEMGPQPTLPGWSLYDRSRTNAEVIAALYALLRDAAGQQTLIDGCNTVSQLGQGVFDLQRTGDDTSGRQWERTRRMGVNTLAFRIPQQGTFHIIDADQVGITDDVPWEFNRQWLDLLARSGTATIVSPGPAARKPEQRAALKEAFAVAAAGGVQARPVDWMETSTPENWQGTGKSGEQRRYRWSGEQGASAFLAP